MISGFFTSGNETLYYEKMELPGVPTKTLILHGAGKSDLTRTTLFRQELLALGIPTLAIDFSGHGKSSSNTLGSVRKRIGEARKAVEILDEQENITLMGFSMSGEVCIQLSEYFSVGNIILFVPGLYHKNALDIPFGEDFSQKIREKDSWKETGVGEKLRNFHGNILLFQAEHDTVIPDGIYEIIIDNTKHIMSKKLFLKDAPHMLALWMNENPDKARMITKEVVQFINL